MCPGTARLESVRVDLVKRSEARPRVVGNRRTPNRHRTRYREAHRTILTASRRRHRVRGMKINADLTTTFDSDQEALAYGRAVRRTMVSDMMQVPPEQWELIRGWSLAFEAVTRPHAVGERMDSGGLLFMSIVAPGRLLLAVIDHFGGLEALHQLDACTPPEADAAPTPWACCGYGC